jgi:hypothetical protein
VLSFDAETVWRFVNQETKALSIGEKKEKDRTLPGKVRAQAYEE